jgi:hypothetical protein
VVSGPKHSDSMVGLETLIRVLQSGRHHHASRKMPDITSQQPARKLDPRVDCSFRWALDAQIALAPDTDPGLAQR